MENIKVISTTVVMLLLVHRSFGRSIAEENALLSTEELNELNIFNRIYDYDCQNSECTLCINSLGTKGCLEIEVIQVNNVSYDLRLTLTFGGQTLFAKALPADSLPTICHSFFTVRICATFGLQVKKYTYDLDTVLQIRILTYLLHSFYFPLMEIPRTNQIYANNQADTDVFLLDYEH